MKEVPSKPLRFPAHPMLLIGFFVFLLGLGSVILSARIGATLLFPPVLLVAAMLPPIGSVAWMIPHSYGLKRKDETKEPSEAESAAPESATQPSLSWRRGLLAFAGGGTISVIIAVILEILLPVIILSLVFNLADTVRDSLNTIFRALSSRNVADALTNRGFIYLFLQIALIVIMARYI